MTTGSDPDRARPACPALVTAPPLGNPWFADTGNDPACRRSRCHVLPPVFPQSDPSGAGPCIHATHVLAYCDMRTLYLRNVPEEVVERLERLARRDGTSVGAVAVRELADVSRRADNPALLGALPDLGVDPTAIVADIEAARAER